MTEKERAQEYEKNAECIEIDDYGHKVYGYLEIEQAWLAGFEAGKPQEYNYIIKQLCEAREIICSMISEYKRKNELNYFTINRGKELLKKGLFNE